ncbi:MAG: Stk1 family PASTA domain-containing Ser/Thr kinase [Actinobacteria bacterium]|uniref:Unannotated protein n=1 Tax=freshwater metagenome TaxID=449393 RepID=A0A6J6LJR5_9ZZZZ|nr:Stk1 family PASTA domain-containing Ser/Thr kinase [Actinomycetota bacterium]MSW47101.1 Stk1 family PASTA domain-containing Ser/Thr kinase [Actinomycetota bacterium]MSX24588.1 Stk1 family PASTA domain-containing Ser/Thr kinase [Actinomycetota bacterium]MSY46379.1 Stk1 family PASTA domain-containing Ser/Thr kinase [Actinomycetota bacterium]MSY56973.1 Stk1 family PASTA domain-containing Ser/Thr kinase [Actinomycetota bacterium]
MSDLSGEIIDGRYELIKQIATGGMATIYEGFDTRLDRKVAVKIMHPHLANDEAFVSRFIREAKASAALSHPNIVSVQDQGWNQSGVPAVFLVMEYVEGHTLRDYIFEKGALAPLEAIKYLTPVLSALAAAHRIGIVHRDMKPENILISHNGRVKIADFGLAHGEMIGSTLTAESSVILGSVSYLSPEQVQRGIADARSDVYAVGILAFELLTGEKPFQGETPIEIAYKHVNEKVPAPSTLNPAVSPEFDALILSATSGNPDERPRDAGAFLESLHRVALLLDPKRVQMSLELDLPPAPVRDKSRKSPRVAQSNNPAEPETVSPMATESKASKSKKQVTSARVKRNRKIALALIVALTAGIWFLVVGPGAKVVVPSIAGMTINQAKKTLKPLGLSLEINEETFSEDIPKGKIISSKPGGGGRVGEGGVVGVTLSKGAERYEVPVLKGLTLEAATALITSQPLTMGTVVEEYKAGLVAGLVISSTPKAGTKLERDALINLVVSKAAEQVALTSYVGLSGEQALNELTDAGFDVASEYAFSDIVPVTAVISQTPTTPTADKGSKITIVISQGSEWVSVPNVYSLSLTDAQNMLVDLDFVVEITGKGGKVKNISPANGTKVKRGSTVTITVG